MRIPLFKIMCWKIGLKYFLFSFIIIIIIVTESKFIIVLFDFQRHLPKPRSHLHHAWDESLKLGLTYRLDRLTFYLFSDA